MEGIIRKSLWTKGLVVGIIILLVGASIVSASNVFSSPHSRTVDSGNYLYVGGSGPENYTRIQDAIDNATNGDTIFVYDDSSPYNETITIYKSIHLIRIGENKSYISGGTSDESNTITIIQIDADYCSISGFIITRNDDAITVGININSSNNIIFNNLIINTTEGLVIQRNMQHNSIFWNTITDNYYGIKTENTINNTYAHNIITSNTLYGMYLYLDSDHNIIYNNAFSKNNYGLRIKSSSDNKMYHNNFMNNSLGVYVCCGAQLNYFYNNNFFNNSNTHAYEDRGLSNIWYDSLNGTGNYWDDYTGRDENHDGIGDTPYNISNANNQDLYPLIEPWVNHPPNTPTITGQANGEIGTPYNCTIQTTDPDRDDLLYFVDWGDGTIGTFGFYESGEEIILSHTWDTKGTYTIKVKAIDECFQESDWATLTVTMPYLNNKPTPQFFELLFQRFPNAFLILRQLVEYSSGSGLFTQRLSTFTTKQDNNPPNRPSNPSPPNQATDVDINTDLSWTGGDPDVGDTVTYDVYFGSVFPLQKVASNISIPSYDPETLAYDELYRWSIVAWDNHGLSTQGLVWWFRTAWASSHPPE